MNAKQRRQERRKVEQGFGPRHAFNAQEGDELVPEELPTPPAVPETRGGRAMNWLAKEVQSGILPDEAIEEIKRNPAGLGALGAYATAGIALSGGKGGKGKLSGEHGLVPAEMWNSWKTVRPA